MISLQSYQSSGGYSKNQSEGVRVHFIIYPFTANQLDHLQPTLLAFYDSIKYAALKSVRLLHTGIVLPLLS